MRSAAALEKWYQDRKAVADFYVVYIREAHAADSPRPIKNAPKEPRNDIERKVLADTCIREAKLTIPFIVDDMENTACKAYAAWPDRLFIVGTDGKIAYAGARGPGGFRPKECDKRLLEMVENKSKP